jgi:hypothetical protein
MEQLIRDTYTAWETGYEAAMQDTAQIIVTLSNTLRDLKDSSLTGELPGHRELPEQTREQIVYNCYIINGAYAILQREIDRHWSTVLPKKQALESNPEVVNA